MNNFDPKTFYFNLPLYTDLEVNDETNALLTKLLNFNSNIHAYNPKLKENTTFSVRTLVDLKKRAGSVSAGSTYAEMYLRSDGFDFSELRCLRTNDVFYVFYYFEKITQRFFKIGQIPSIADLHISQIRNYDKVLDKEKLKEFTRAIGLAANGVGIGSFVYLRRIFEDLIEEAHLLSLKEDGFDETKYSKSRMDEKIQLLQSHLPLFLVENKKLYGILSKGIHELSEDECLKIYDVVKVGIELILDEKLTNYERETKLLEAKKRINDAASSVIKN